MIIDFTTHRYQYRITDVDTNVTVCTPSTHHTPPTHTLTPTHSHPHTLVDWRNATEGFPRRRNIHAHNHPRGRFYRIIIIIIEGKIFVVEQYLVSSLLNIFVVVACTAGKGR